MPVEMLNLVYAMCQMLWVLPCIETTVDICYDKFSIYFGYLLCVICRLLYAKAHEQVYICQIPCASYCKFTLTSGYIPISVPVSACFMLSLACQLQYTYIYMPAHECLIFPIMLDCYMPNTMTIAMSFSMTTEQVGHFIIYIYLLSGYDSPYCRYRDEITIIPPWHQFISQISGISVC
jgi:hypothetical protein